MRHARTRLVIASLAAVMLLSSGCIGKFRLTAGILDWNNTLSNKFVNEIVFLSFNVIPIYPIALTGDAFIFNTIEFWGGSNPFANVEGGNALADTHTFQDGDVKLVLERRATSEGRALVVRSFERDELHSEATLVDRSDGTVLKLGSNGEVLAIARVEADGTVRIRDMASGEERVVAESSRP
jgi:hypothetical protein